MRNLFEPPEYKIQPAKQFDVYDAACFLSLLLTNSKNSEQYGKFLNFFINHLIRVSSLRKPKRKNAKLT